MKAPSPVSTTAMASAKAHVRRDRSETLRTGTIIGELVADSADGLQGPSAERPVDLGTKIADIDIDHVGVGLQIPDPLGDLTPRQHPPRLPHEALQQRELLG